VGRATFAGIRPERGVAPRPKTALLVDELRAAVATCGERRIDVRDRALILLGFAAALRRSELVGLDVGDVAFEGEGVVLRLRRSKTNRWNEKVENLSKNGFTVWRMREGGDLGVEHVNTVDDAVAPSFLVHDVVVT